MKSSTYSISDLAKISGIKAHTLRVWEQRYGLLLPKRTNTNIRYYDENDLKFLLNITILNEHGYRISQIAKMPFEEVLEKVNCICGDCKEYLDQVKALTISMIELDENKFEKTLSTSVLQFGFEKTMMHIVYPFFEKVGVMWLTEAINPAQEHFISYLIRQKLIVAIDGQRSVDSENAKRAILFLPAGEEHEIALLFTHYLLKSRGVKVLYLGQNVPFDDLVSVTQIYKPHHLFTIFTTAFGEKKINGYLQRLSNAAPDVNIIVSGNQLKEIKLKTLPGVLYAPSPKKLISLIEDGQL